MAAAPYWPDDYVEKKKSGREAVRLIRPGQRVFIGSSCGEPQHLVRELAEASSSFADLEIVRLMSLETTPLTLIANKTMDQIFNIRSFYLGSTHPSGIARNRRFITPINLSAVPQLFRNRTLPIQVALIQVCPPDDFGWMSLGVSVDITLSAALSADLVIAQVNSRMPRVLGRSFIHVNDVDVIVEYEEDILTVEEPPEMEPANEIARYIARLIEDGSTLHISPGATTQAILLALSDKKDLGIHTEYITDSIMKLASRGAITNRRKTRKEGRMVASSAIGSQNLYEFLDNNPSIDFQPSDYVNDPAIIASQAKMVSLNVAMAIDLTGQVAADALAYNHFSGVTGMLDFVRGASRSPGGKSIMMLPSTTGDGRKCRIVPMLDEMAVVVPRGDAHYVVTEFGVVNLHGKSLQERAMAMISIARPDFRGELFSKARELGLISQRLTLDESIRGVYPRKLEETLVIDGVEVTVRPSKPVDARRIQEHFYNLDKEDILSRFFYEKNRFQREEIVEVTQVDYVNELTLIAVTGEFGFGKVVALGEYLMETGRNVAEVAFSVNGEWQGKGLGKILMRKLAEAARENGLDGFVAFTGPNNRGMINLFKTLPYRTRTVMEDGILHLSCRFDEPSD